MQLQKIGRFLLNDKNIFGYSSVRRSGEGGEGSVLALKHFNEKTALPAIIFVFVCIITAALLVPVWSKTGGKTKA